MKILTAFSIKILLAFFVFTSFSHNAFGDIVLDSGTISVQQGSGGGFLGGTSTFNLSTADIQNVELLSNFNIVDAGVEIRINGTSLFPLFDDISQFSSDVVYLDTGVTQGNGNVESPFSANNNGLPRLTVTADSAGATFGGGAFVNSTSVIDYTPNFTVQDFSSLLTSGDNTIEFFVLNNFQGANLQGDYTVTLVSAVPEPSATCLGFFAIIGFVSRRRR